MTPFGCRAPHPAPVAFVLTFFVLHWALSVFFQSFFLHRYGAHRMLTMSPRAERVFHFLTFLCQGSSYLNPRGYAILHREHHAFSDTDRDPHSPHTSKGFIDMNWKTATRYAGLWRGTIQPEARFLGGYPSWPALERIGDSWLTRIAFGLAYTIPYFLFAPHWAFFLLLPLHWFMGPLHGAIVNWCGHRYGYRNYQTSDRSVNTLPFDFVTLGELFQNNHHRYGQAYDFAARPWEIDPTAVVIRILAALKIVEIEKEQRMRWPEPVPAGGLVEANPGVVSSGPARPYDRVPCPARSASPMPS
jgi:stearoyl-CoA desaturase (delta-9 desaturase)